MAWSDWFFGPGKGVLRQRAERLFAPGTYATLPTAGQDFEGCIAVRLGILYVCSKTGGSSWAWEALDRASLDAVFLTPAEGNTAYVNVTGDTMTGHLDGDVIRSTGATDNPASGSGAEVVYTGGEAFYQGYNRTGAAYLPVTLRGSTVALGVGGTPFIKVLSATTTWNPANILAGGAETKTVTVTGAAVGDPAFAGHTAMTSGKWSITAYVSATDTVSVNIVNHEAIAGDWGSGTLRAIVWKF